MADDDWETADDTTLTSVRDEMLLAIGRMPKLMMRFDVCCFGMTPRGRL